MDERFKSGLKLKVSSVVLEKIGWSGWFDISISK